MGREPVIADADFRLYLGNALEVLPDLPAGSVDCVITSPPYWNLRDYGTGEWVGGDEECGHEGAPKRTVGNTPSASSTLTTNNGAGPKPGDKYAADAARETPAGDCAQCGARWVDGQIGLEETPAEFVASLVEVFREVRRVLADHGTVWLNLGDSYNAYNGNRGDTGSTLEGRRQHLIGRPHVPAGSGLTAPGLKSKDLVGIPWRVGFALQDDGWYLRSDIIWSKKNPMPESVTDRPTKSHEYIFLLSKQPRYYFDQEAVREPHTSTRWGGVTITQPPTTKYAEATAGGFSGAAEALSRPGREWNAYPEGGRNIRTVWEIATQPFAGAHFATFPPEIVRRALLAGCPVRVCRTCGRPSEAAGGLDDCGHDDFRPGVVLDPFMGSGTTALVAREHGRHAVGVELNPEYARLCAQRLQQQSLFAA